MQKLRIAVLGSTRGTDMQAIIDAIEGKRLSAQIVLVVSDKKGAFILERSDQHGIETLAIDYKKHTDRAGAEKEIVKALSHKKADLVLLIGFMKILSPYFVNAFRGRVWNIHPSLLPKYAGGMDRDVHATVIQNGEKEAGCTLHEVSDEVDRGKIIMQKRVEIGKDETPQSLKEKVQKLEQQCLLESIKMVTEGKLHIGTEN